MNTNEVNTSDKNEILSDKINVFDIQSPPQSTPAGETAKIVLKNQLKDVGKVANETAQRKVKIPAGKKVEDFYKMKAETDLPKKRGRPKKYSSVTDYLNSENKEVSTEAPPAEESVKSCYEANTTDMITPMISLIAVPILSKKVKRKKKDIDYTPEQRTELSKICPAGDFMKPSYINYAIMAISLLVINVMQSEKITIDPEQAKEAQNNMQHFTRTHEDEQGVINMVAEPI